MRSEENRPIIQSDPKDASAREPSTKKRLRRWKLRLLAVAFGCLLSLLLMEAVFRVYVAVRGWTSNCYLLEYQLVVSHPVNGYELEPGFFFQSETTRLSVNSLGLRSDEPTGERPLIALVGGSAVFGYLVSDEQTAAELLQQEFARIGVDIDVQNAGVAGYNLNQTTVRFREKVAPLKPDYVLMYLGWNDLSYIVSEDPEQEHFYRRPPPTVMQKLLSHSTLYGFVESRLLRKSSVLVPQVGTAVTPTPAGVEKFHRNLETLAGEIEKIGAQLIVCCPMMATHPEVDPSLYPNLSDDPEHRRNLIALGSWLHEELKSFATSHDAIWIDAWVPPDDTLLGDPVHLTPQGERVVADLWFQSLRELDDFQSD